MASSRDVAIEEPLLLRAGRRAPCAEGSRAGVTPDAATIATAGCRGKSQLLGVGGANEELLVCLALAGRTGSLALRGAFALALGRSLSLDLAFGDDWLDDFLLARRGDLGNEV